MRDLRYFLTKRKFKFSVLFGFIGLVLVLAVLSNSLPATKPFGNSIDANRSESPIEDGKLVADPFEFTITTEKATYKLQERIKMNVTLRNIGEENVTVTFFTRPNPSPYWFWRVYDDRQQLVFYHKYVGRLPAFEEITLQPGEFMQRECTWNQKATNSGQQVPPGIYSLTAKTGFIYNEEEIHLEAQSEILIDNITGEPIVLEKVFNEVFKLAMIIPNDTYALDEPIRFTLRLTIISNESVVIYYGWMNLLRYRVINPSGDMIYHKTEARGEYVAMVIVPETLGPNMTHEKLFIWRQVYQNYYDGAVPIDENPITTPGDYTIIGQTYFYLKENGRLSRIVEAELQIQVRII